MWFCYVLGLTLGVLASYGLGRAKAGGCVAVGVGVPIAFIGPFFIATALHIDW